MNPLRIGFLSTAGIGRKNWKAILNSGNCVVSAVASRDAQKAREFIRQCQNEHTFDIVPRALGSYEELIASPEVDAIYFPLPTGLRHEWVIRAAQHGKHILCEKPCAAHSAELEAMLAACENNGVQFLDGVMFMHNVRLPKIRDILDDGHSVGSIRRIASAFSFYPGEDFFARNIRVNSALEPAGCAGDLGWYCIRFALWALDWKLPESVRAHALATAGDGTTPTEFSATLNYPGGVTVEFFSSFLAAKQQWVFVSGQKGWLRLPDFVHPFNGYEPAFEVNERFQSVSGGAPCPAGGNAMDYGHATAQDTRMWRNFAAQIFSGQRNADWPRWASLTQRVLDACLESARRQTIVQVKCD